MTKDLNIAAIIQARFSSTRFPGKVIETINGKSILEIIIKRLKLCSSINEIIVATTFNEEDEISGLDMAELGMEAYQEFGRS